jgi:uroporphyrin-III C-methyltransferase / precorrin-2 dehydrogenase / sirohydrochlorin ferrochelatase
MQQLPIFVNLAGRAVILLGEGEAAEAKARLVHAAGGAVVSEDTQDAALAFIAIDDNAQAQAAATRLRVRGLLVNVVDKPELSDFLMGAIVDRSPVIVAISTAGTSASLARALRTRLEALLPASLGPLALGIRAARAAASGRFATPAERRRLWDAALADGGVLDPLAVHPDPAAAVALALTHTPDATAQLVTITFASADPGDLTLNQLNALARCDLLVAGTDVPPAIIDRARRDAQRRRDLPQPLPPGLTVQLLP